MKTEETTKAARDAARKEADAANLERLRRVQDAAASSSSRRAG